MLLCENCFAYGLNPRKISDYSNYPLLISERIRLCESRPIPAESSFTKPYFSNIYDIIVRLEHAMPITHHTNGEPLLSSLIFVLSQFATILLVVWSANGYGSALTSKTSSNLLNDNTHRCVCAGNCVISIQTYRARCALYKKILDLLDEESVSGESSGRAGL